MPIYLANGDFWESFFILESISGDLRDDWLTYCMGGEL